VGIPKDHGYGRLGGGGMPRSASESGAGEGSGGAEREASALERLLQREIQKLASALALRRAAERRGLGRDRGAQGIPDPAWPDLDGLVRAPVGSTTEWIEERLAFVREAERLLRHAGPRERAFFWLGASSGFTGAPPRGIEALRGVLALLQDAAAHYREVARVTGGDEDATRRREEPWDASLGLVPRRTLRGERLLEEARELLEEQCAALELLGESAAEETRRTE
jgi:hypothetical protein